MSAELHLGHLPDAPLRLPLDVLCRHAVCLGATGSGKTALCLVLIEEVLLHQIPVLAIDPKGDLANLLLTFPGLDPRDFMPWVDPRVLQAHGGDPGAAAISEAARWREGLASSGVSDERLHRLRAGATFTVHTPGSEAGRPLALAGGMAPPGGPRESWHELAQAAALALLTLAGIPGNTGPSREEALLTALLLHAWEQGHCMEVPDILPWIQRPPFRRLGVLDLEVYYPERERLELLLGLNHLLATRGHLLRGAPLSIEGLLREQGRPACSVIGLSHLGEQERMAFVTALLGHLVGWMRRQPGSSGLRALVVLDEATGYLPPVAAPPSKGPLLTLIKQGRSQGVGVLVATQNAADLDYKALSNAGTWLVGRLGAGRDRQRVKEALEGSDLGLPLPTLDAALASLEPRNFLVHGFWTTPQVFRSRWTMSYLRGPLSLEELRRLAPPTLDPVPLARATPPMAPPGVTQLFPSEASSTLEPCLIAAARLGYQDRARAIDLTLECVLALPLPPGSLAPDWAAAEPLPVPWSSLSEQPTPGASFAALPGQLNGSSLRTWRPGLVAYLASRVERWWWCEAAGVRSEPGESEASFRSRLAEPLGRRCERMVEARRQQQARKERGVEERLRRAEQAVARRKEQAAQARTATALAAGATVLGGLLGGRWGGKAARTIQWAARAKDAESEVKRAEENAAACREELRALQGAHARELEELRARYQPGQAHLEVVELRPARGRIEVVALALGWLEGVGAGG
jgi:hypothetical protein